MPADAPGPVLSPQLLALGAEAGGALAARGERVAVVESSAGGLISAALLAVPGASRYYAGGIVVYTLDGARATLGGAAPLPEGVRSASGPFASWLAGTAATMFGTPWAVGETGAAGPSGNPYGDPAGHAWVAVTGPGGTTPEHVLTGAEDRLGNMGAFAAAALALLVRRLAA